MCRNAKKIWKKKQRKMFELPVLEVTNKTHIQSTHTDRAGISVLGIVSAGA